MVFPMLSTIYNDNSGITHVSFGSATGYGAPVSLGVSAFLTGNVLGGSRDGFLAVNAGIWWFYVWNGTSLVGTSTGLPYDSTASQYQLADVDGDGRPDLISLYNNYDSGTGKTTSPLYIRLNTSTGGVPSFSSTLTLANTLMSTAGAQLI